MTLAILEHWFLVVPLPAAALWNWGLKSRAPVQAFDAEIVAGFLGAGKTTFVRRLLAEADPDVKTVVLVNDFSDVGVDGSLLRGAAADVVELPNGCICCSLRNDLAAQLKETIARWAPRRVLIEPSGVADVAALVGVLGQPDLAPLVRSLRLDTVLDAGAFLRDFARRPGYFEAQARLAPLLVVNKADLVAPAVLRLVEETLRALNPAARIVRATYGVVQDGRRRGAAARPRPRRRARPRARRRPPRHEPALGLHAWSARLQAPATRRACTRCWRPWRGAPSARSSA